MFGLDKAAARIAALIAAVAALCLVFFVVSYCSQREKLKEARGAEAAAEGRTISATEAIKEMGALADRGEALDSEVKEAQDAIRKAPPAERNRVARYQLCRVQQLTNCDRLLDPS